MRRYAVFFVAIPAAALMGRLGVWQLDRLDQRRTLNAALEGNRNLPAIDLSEAPPERLPRFRQVTASGFFDFEHQVVVDARSFEGVPAVVVVTPLRLPTGKAVLVERGLALSPDARTVPLEKLTEPDSAVAGGVVVLEPGPRDLPAAAPGTWPRHVQWLDPGRLAPLFPYEILPYVVRRTEMPAGAPRGLRAVPIPVLDSGPHLSYAIQWFAFAMIAIGGSIAIFRRERRNRSPHAQSP